MVGSTDTHTALSAVKEDNYIGKHAGTEPSPRNREPFPSVVPLEADPINMGLEANDHIVPPDSAANERKVGCTRQLPFPE